MSYRPVRARQTTAQVHHLQPTKREPADQEQARDELADDIADRVLAILDSRNASQPRAPAADATLVFVICSFTPHMEPVYAAITAAARSAGLRAERVKDVQGDYRITETILDMIRHARLVVADLTDERPNVYFELGYARGLGKTVITLIRTGVTAHFDVRDWAYLEYFDSRPLEDDLLKRLKYELQLSDAPTSQG